MFAVLFAFNDSYTTGWGSAATTKGPTNVQMVNEDIQINPVTGKVVVTFTFKNHGDEAVTAMAFPEDNYNAGLDDGFSYFYTFVDGLKMNAARTQLPTTSEDDVTKNYWWVKEVPFAAGQTRKIRNEYKSFGFEDTMRIRAFGYILSTGATWNGNIERSTAVMDLSGLAKGTAVVLNPKGYTIKGRKVTWEWKNFKPTTAHNISVRWLPKAHENKDSLTQFKYGQDGIFRLK